MKSEQKVLGSLLKSILLLIFIEVKNPPLEAVWFLREALPKGMITYSMVIQTHYVSLVDLVNAQLQKFPWAYK